MQKNLNQKAALALILLLIISMTVATLSTVKALDVPTFLEISAAPNPTGIGQTVFVNVFMTKPHSNSWNE